MRITPIDPREVSTQIDEPEYRLDLWSRADATTAPDAWTTDTLLISNADVSGILSWAASVTGADQQFVLYASVPGDQGVALIRLEGSDPTASGLRPGE